MKQHLNLLKPFPGCFSARVLPSLTLLVLAGLLWFAPSLNAQVAVRLQMSKQTYILNESVTATVSITNHAGRELVLRGEGSRPWLNFHLTSNGRVVPLARKMNYRSVTVPVGQTISRTVSISSSYAMASVGNFTCMATVNMPGPTRNGFSSNRVHFTVATGRPVWVQRAGIPNAPGEIREYKLIAFTGNRALELYAQVDSANTGGNIRTIPLGKVMNFRKPTATLDSANNMHALYQVKPNLFTHTSISPKGAVLSSTQYKRGASGDPRLMDFGDGVRVAGGVPFDLATEREQRKRVRSITERPAGVYR